MTTELSKQDGKDLKFYREMRRVMKAYEGIDDAINAAMEMTELGEAEYTTDFIETHGSVFLDDIHDPVMTDIYKIVQRMRKELKERGILHEGEIDIAQAEQDLVKMLARQGDADDKDEAWLDLFDPKKQPAKAFGKTKEEVIAMVEALPTAQERVGYKATLFFEAQVGYIPCQKDGCYEPRWGDVDEHAPATAFCEGHEIELGELRDTVEERFIYHSRDDGGVPEDFRKVIEAYESDAMELEDIERRGNMLVAKFYVLYPNDVPDADTDTIKEFGLPDKYASVGEYDAMITTFNFMARPKRVCPSCNGDGNIDVDIVDGVQIKTCPTCMGNGSLVTRKFQKSKEFCLGNEHRFLETIEIDMIDRQMDIARCARCGTFMRYSWAKKQENVEYHLDRDAS